MSRALIIQIPLVLILAAVVSLLICAVWIIMLVPLLIWPQLTKPITTRVGREATKQVVGAMTRGARRNGSTVR